MLSWLKNTTFWQRLTADFLSVAYLYLFIDDNTSPKTWALSAALGESQGDANGRKADIAGLTVLARVGTPQSRP